MPIDSGKVSEYSFAAELLRRNLVPCWPSTEIYPYDIVVDTGRFRHRVQVKSTGKVGRSISMDIRRSFGGKKSRNYTKKDTDFIAIHVVSYKAWYIIPVENISQTITVRPGQPDCKFSKYLSAWHLLDDRITK